jgi:hypothetical protein
MTRIDRRVSAQALTVVIAVCALGSATRLVLVHVPSGIDAPPMCTVVTDFWKGDQILC